MDIVSKDVRSRMMSGIGRVNTKPELVLRRLLFERGYRYRLHGNTLPGRPDIVLKSRGAVIFVHGCYWHRHKHCKYAVFPKSNQQFWEKKFSENVMRDIRNEALLRDAGWRVAVVWECALKDRRQRVTVGRIARWLERSTRSYIAT